MDNFEHTKICSSFKALAPLDEFSEFLFRKILFSHCPFSVEMTASEADLAPPQEFPIGK